MPSLDGDELIINERALTKDISNVTLIYFWSISCNQCETSIIKLKELQQLFQNKLTIIAIHMPRSEEDKDVKAIKSKLKQLAIALPVYVDQHLRLTNAFENRFVPAYYLFDKEKKLRFYQAGVPSKKLLQQKIERFI